MTEVRRGVEENGKGVWTSGDIVASGGGEGWGQQRKRGRGIPAQSLSVFGACMPLHLGLACLCIWGLHASASGACMPLHLGLACLCIWGLHATASGACMPLHLGLACHCIWGLHATASGACMPLHLGLAWYSMLCMFIGVYHARYHALTWGGLILCPASVSCWAFGSVTGSRMCTCEIQGEECEGDCSESYV